MNNQESLDQPRSFFKMPGRPTLLTVVCVLSFIYIGMGLLRGFASLTQGPLSSSDVEYVKTQMDELIGESDGVEKIQQAYYELIDYKNERFYPITLTELLFSMMKFIGVMLMFRLFKKGYLMYLLGDLATVAYLAIALPNQMTVASSIFFGIFTVIFAVIYGLHLKYMK